MIQFTKSSDIIQHLNYHVQPHFKMYEFFKTKHASKQIHPAYLHPIIATNLFNTITLCERLREQVNEPLVINSGYRTIAVNSSVGGDPLSLHCFGTAFDVKVTSPNFASKFVSAIDRLKKHDSYKRKYPSLKCIVYPTYIHVQYLTSIEFKKFLSKNNLYSIVAPFNKFIYDETTENLTLDTCYPTDSY